MTDDPLLEAAEAARARAHVPYSGWRVGAAVQDEAGRIFGGCNVENGSYSLTICGERVALFKAVSEGAGRLVRVLLVAEGEEIPRPCGACRQVLIELAPDAELTMVSATTGARDTARVPDLLPGAFLIAPTEASTDAGPRRGPRPEEDPRG